LGWGTPTQTSVTNKVAGVSGEDNIRRIDMKKILLYIFLTTFVIIGFTGQSWAFGSRGHHRNGQDGNSSSASITGSESSALEVSTSWTNALESAQLGGNPLNQNLGTGGNIPSLNFETGANNLSSDPVDPSSENSSSADPVVPEPLTVYLLGIGLIGIFLIRKIRWFLFKRF